MSKSESVLVDKDTKKKSTPDWFPKRKRRKVSEEVISSDPFLNDYWIPFYESEDDMIDSCMDYLLDHPKGDILEADIERESEELKKFCEETKKFFAKYEESENLSLEELLIIRGLLCI